MTPTCSNFLISTRTPASSRHALSHALSHGALHEPFPRVEAPSREPEALRCKLLYHEEAVVSPPGVGRKCQESVMSMLARIAMATCAPLQLSKAHTHTSFVEHPRRVHHKATPEPISLLPFHLTRDSTPHLRTTTADPMPLLISRRGPSGPCSSWTWTCKLSACVPHT